MIKNLVSFGCSWTYGDELVDPKNPGTSSSELINEEYRNKHSFAGLIADHFGWNYTCMAYPGCSLQAMIWNFNWWLDHASEDELNETFILVGLTVESRTSWYNPYYQVRDSDWGLHRYMHSSWLQSSNDDIKDEPYMQEWRQMNKLHYVLSDCSQAQELKYKEAVRFFDGISARNNIPMLQVNVLSAKHNINLPTLLDDVSILDFFDAELKVATTPIQFEGKHPNEKGHKIISECLIPHVKNAIIHE